MITQTIPTGYKQTELGLIPEEWDIVELGKISNFKYGIGESAQNSGEYLYVRIKDITSDGKLDRSDLAYMSQEKVSNSDMLEYGDILIARTGATYGKSYLFKETIPSCYGGFLIKLLLDKQKTDYYYIFSFTQSQLYWGQANNLVGGGAQPQFNANVICNLKIPLPLLPEQKAIAEILSSLDDKIELLEKQNETLENIGQAIFKSWFVDFEPFQDNLVESEMGMIPRGWSIGTLENITEINTKSISAKNLNNQEIIHYSIPNFDSYCYPIEEIGDDIQSNKTIVNKNTILVSKLNPEKTKRILFVGDTEGYSSTEFINYEAIDGNYTFLYYQLSSDLFYNTFCGYTTGTTESRQRVKPKETMGIPIIIPGEGEIKKFEDICRDYLHKKVNNNLQIKNLIDLKESLLPRLMSGKIRVSNIR